MNFWTVSILKTFLQTQLMTLDWFKVIKRLGSPTFSFILLHLLSYILFNYFLFFRQFLGVYVVSWSLLTIHTNPAIALQLVRGSCNGQQRPLTSKKDTKFHSICFRIVFSRTLTIRFGKHNPDQGYFWNFYRAREKGAGWEK